MGAINGNENRHIMSQKCATDSARRMGGIWLKIVGNRRGGCTGNINADQSRRTEHLIDTSIIINPLRTSFERTTLARIFLLPLFLPLPIIVLLFSLMSHPHLTIPLNIICARIKRENDTRLLKLRRYFIISLRYLSAVCARRWIHFPRNARRGRDRGAVLLNRKEKKTRAVSSTMRDASARDVPLIPNVTK